MSLLIDRRTFLAAPFFVRNLISAPPSDQFRLGAFGAGGMAFVTFDVLPAPSQGQTDLRRRSGFRANSTSTSRARPKPASTRTGARCSPKSTSNLDAVCVGTPDHMHAPMAMSAMHRGLPGLPAEAHGAQRPRSPHAHRHGAQEEPGHPDGHPDSFHAASTRPPSSWCRAAPSARSRKCIPSAKRSGAIPIRCPKRTDPVPATLNWDHWIGVAQPRPFITRCLPPGELAQAHRFRHRHLRRHGLPHPGPGLRRARPARAHLRALRRRRAERRELGAPFGDPLRLPGKLGAFSAVTEDPDNS